jgi:hypothetical protein
MYKLAWNVPSECAKLMAYQSTVFRYPRRIYNCDHVYTAISIKVVHKQSRKVEYECKRLLGIANKLINFHSDSQQPFALVFDFSALLVDNLNWNSCIQCDNASLKHFAGSALSSRSHTIKHPQTSCPKITGTGRQSLLINKSFNCDISLELVFLGFQYPMFHTFLVFFKIISVISSIFVYLYQVYRIPGPPPPWPTPKSQLISYHMFKHCF